MIPSAVNLVSVSPRAAAVARSPYFPFHCQGTGSDRQVHSGYVNRCVLTLEPCVYTEFLVPGLDSPLRLAQILAKLWVASSRWISCLVQVARWTSKGIKACVSQVASSNTPPDISCPRVVSPSASASHIGICTSPASAFITTTASYSIRYVLQGSCIPSYSSRCCWCCTFQARHLQ